MFTSESDTFRSRVAHKADIGANAENGSFVRIAVIGATKMLRSIANVRFGEAALRRGDP